jgi:hypothetical protein
MRLVIEAPGIRTGAVDKEVHMKARLYRTAVSVSLVAIVLEGLGATWKWS